MAVFYVVATPIGNLEDITIRAIRILKEVDCILCEDTRVTKKLLSAHGISTRTESYHTHSSDVKVERVLELLAEGKNLALVSDAGTPGVSDPGSMLVAKIRERFGNETNAACEPLVKIESVPGASALTAALSIAGMPVNEFTFVGFLPHKKGRETLFREIAAADHATIFYESPHRIMKALESLASMPEMADRQIAVMRELTKMFEQTVRGTAVEVRDYFIANEDKVRGEFVVIVRGK